MIRKRFPFDRSLRIVGWTTVTIAWIIAVVARTVGGPPPQAEPLPVAPAAQRTAPSPLAGVPAMPETGLVVLRSTSRPAPEPEVRTVVVTPPAGSAISATATRSSGS